MVESRPPARESGISFAALPAGDTITIDFESNGCFHSERETLSYAPAPAPHIGRPGREGAVELTADQVARLDGLLTFYRKRREGGCTTEDKITFIQQRAGRKVRRERYVDATCKVHLLDTSPELLRRLGITDPPVLPIPRILDGLLRASIARVSNWRIPPPDPEKSEARRRLRDREVEVEGRQRVMALAGYEDMRREFIVEKNHLGRVNLAPYSLYVQLRATRPRLVDAAWWWNPVTDGREERSWHDFLRAHRAVERAVAQHRWLEEWKRAAPGRHLEAHIVGVEPYSVRSAGSNVVALWQGSGLKGKPGYEVLMRRYTDWSGTVFFGDEDARALVSRSKGSERRHWLDSLDIRDGSEYVIVTREGKWTRHTRRPAGN